MIQTSAQIDALAAAMAKIQATIEGAVKDSSNPHFKSKYADLSAVWTAWQKVGPANGMAVMQFPGSCEGNRMEMTTLLTHSSGQWVRSTLSIPLAKVDAQGYGSATTYARRYALAAAVGIAPEDDDGSAASKPQGAANDGPAPRQKLDGPYTSKTALWNAFRAFDRELRGCGDSGEFEGLLSTDDAKALIKQCERDAPALLDGGGDLPAEFVPLNDLIAQRRKDFSDLEHFENAAGNMRAG